MCGDDPARFISFSARFADQVMYGDDIITKIWVTGPGTGIVRAETAEGQHRPLAGEGHLEELSTLAADAVPLRARRPRRPIR